MGCDTTCDASRVFRTIWIAPKCYQTTHLLFCQASTRWYRNGRKSCSSAHSKTWECLIDHHMFCRAMPRYLVHGTLGRLKTWLIAFNFDRCRAFFWTRYIFRRKPSYGCGTTYNAHRVFRTIWITPECQQTIHLWFCCVATEWPVTVKVVLKPVQSHRSP